MKIQKIMLTAFAVASLCAGEAIAADSLYLVGDASPSGWNATVPEGMTDVGGDTFIWEGNLAKGEFKFLLYPGTWQYSIVATQDNQNIADGATFPINDNSNGGYEDYKFYNPEAGPVRILVNLAQMKATFHRPAVALVGDAVKGWADPAVNIPIFRDNDGNISWTGQLRAGAMKILTGDCSAWIPCYNASAYGLDLTSGEHQLVYNDGDNGVPDHNYNVAASGIYTLTFNLTDKTLQVSKADDPDLSGGFTAEQGSYLVGYNADDKRVHFGPVPNRLYIGTSESDYKEIPATGGGEFYTTMRLEAGKYYKLFADPQKMIATAISPDRDTDITSETSNLSPMAGYSYTVPATDYYQLRASFADASPSLVATSNATLSGITDQAFPPFTVRAENGVVSVEGRWSKVEIYEPGGRKVADGAPCLLPEGIYLVIVDGISNKIAIK